MGKLTTIDLPGDAPPKLQQVLSRYTKEYRDLFIEHLKGGTSCDYLSDWLRRNGTPVAASTLKRYRRSLHAG